MIGKLQPIQVPSHACGAEFSEFLQVTVSFKRPECGTTTDDDSEALL